MEIEEINTRNAKRIFSKVGFALFIIGLISTVVSTIIVLISKYVLNFSQETLQSGMYLILVSIISLYLFSYPVGFVMLNNLPSFEYQKKKLHLEQFLRYLIICFSIMQIGNIIGTVLSLFLSSGSAVNPLVLLEDNNILANILLSVVAAPIVEELIFRKQIIDHTKRFGEKSAIIFSAIAFGLFHMNLFQFFYAFGVGLIFGYIYTRTNDIKYTIFLHMIINFFGGIVAPYIVSLVDYSAIMSGSYLYMQGTELFSVFVPVLFMFVYSFAVFVITILGIVMLIDDRRKIHFEPAMNQEGIINGFKTRYLNIGVILFIVLCVTMIILSLLGH